MYTVLSQTAPAETERALQNRGYTVLRLPPCPALAPPVASHPDMLLCPLGDKIFAPAAYLPWGNTVGLHPVPIPESLTEHYPGDVLLNAAAVGEYLFCHRQVSSAIKAEAVRLGMTVCTVRQGYAHCGALALGGRAMITADPSLSSAGNAAGLTVLSLPAGRILLPGFGGYGGLCGGAGGVDEESKTLFFCGTPPDDVLPRVESFCASFGYGVVCLPAPAWTDTGGILFLSEAAARP